MYKTLILGILVLLAGCTSSLSRGWHPKSEQEMYILMGQAMLDAMNQYEAYRQALEGLGKEGPLKGLKGSPHERY